jgi:hypothetical protein
VRQSARQTAQAEVCINSFSNAGRQVVWLAFNDKRSAQSSGLEANDVTG